MTPDERQALREKHSPWHGDEGLSYCQECGDDPFGFAHTYPCDVIKVLDWAEAVAEDLSARIEGGP